MKRNVLMFYSLLIFSWICFALWYVYRWFYCWGGYSYVCDLHLVAVGSAVLSGLPLGVILLKRRGDRLSPPIEGATKSRLIAYVCAWGGTILVFGSYLMLGPLDV